MFLPYLIPLPPDCKRWISLLLLFALAPLGMTGCGGPSTEDLLKRQSMRRNAPEDEEPAPPQEAPPPAEQAVAPVAQGAVTPQPTTPVENMVATTTATALEEFDASELNPQAAGAAATEVAKEKPLVMKPMPVPIKKRKPAEVANDKERAMGTVANLTAIADAVVRYTKERGKLPSTNIRDSSGNVQTLSWRVALLPYLGHKELYERFNFEEPWDGPNNIKLLNYIPEEYTSGDRYDYKTNYLGASGNTYAFDGQEDPGAEYAPLADTIAIAEVDDDKAVPWTKPEDMFTTGAGLKLYLGDLRAAGTYVIWGDGKVGVVPNGVPISDLHTAFVYVGGGEKPPASKINRPIRFDDDLEAFEDNIAAGDTPATTSPTTPIRPVVPTVPEEPKSPVPNAADVATAGQRLKQLFGKRFEEARDDQAKSALASDLLNQAATLQADPAAAFALQSACINIASSAGNFELAVKAVDQRVGQFDVNSIDENYEFLTKFAATNSNRNPASIDGVSYLKRAFPVIYATCVNDEYDRSQELVKNAFKFVNEPRTSPLSKALTRLKSQLTNAQRQYNTAKESLASYREDSSDIAAGLTFGRFLCFIKGDWERGLPLLAKSDSRELKLVAEMDLKKPTTNSDKIALGDEWWRLGEAAKTSLYREACRERAAFWYRDTLASLPESLDQIHVKARLAEAESSATAGSGSPLGSILSLAPTFGVDLTLSLQALARGSKEKEAEFSQEG